MVMLRPLAARAARSVRAMSVAKVAHVLILCLNETGVPVLALLTRRSGKGYEKLRYVHRTPKGASGRSYQPRKKVVFRGYIVNLPWRNRRALPMSGRGQTRSSDVLHMTSFYPPKRTRPDHLSTSQTSQEPASTQCAGCRRHENDGRANDRGRP